MTSRNSERALRTNQSPESDGFRIFMRFADGCRHYLEHTEQISPSDSRAIHLYIAANGPRPPNTVLKRVYHVAYPGLQNVRDRLGKKDMFDIDVVREFYSMEHNRAMIEKGNLICIAYPARVIRVEKARFGSGRKPGEEHPVCKVLVELEPVTGIFKIDSIIPLNKGDWIIVHRMNIVERVSKAFADRCISYLRKLGLNKKRVFPEKAYKYLTELKYSSAQRHASGEFADICEMKKTIRKKRKRGTTPRKSRAGSHDG